MAQQTPNENLESRIIGVARRQFIRKGFTETSMSDIAALTGINRPTLHYYFRTKEKMFQAVFQDIVGSLIPEVRDIMLQQERPIAERIGKVVDAYFRIFTENPSLPLFVVREIQRDARHLMATIRELDLKLHLEKIVRGLQKEMGDGRLKSVPLPFVFYTLYGLLTLPFLSKPLFTEAFLKEEDTFEKLLAEWKPYIVMQMQHLLDKEEPETEKSGL